MTVGARDLAEAGLFCLEGFLDPGVCSRLRNEARRAVHAAATVSKKDDVDALDERTRRTKRAVVPPSAHADLDERLAALLPELAMHFGKPVSGFQQVQFLVYRQRDFFRAHQDNSDDPTLPDEIRARRISLVIFLNGQSRLPQPGCFCGGALTFFNLPGMEVRTNVEAREGMLLAFPSDVMHEVRPVTHGQRFTAVTWFTADAR